jgi:hypothetical protein
MALEEFSFASLATLDDGRIAAAGDRLLSHARLDCLDRPAVDKARKIKLILTVTPVADQSGELRSCTVTVKLVGSLPDIVSPEYDMAIGRGGLLVNELSADDVRQRTLDEAAPVRRSSEASAS